MRRLLAPLLTLALAGSAAAQPAAAEDPSADDEEYDPQGPGALRTRGLDDEQARLRFQVAQRLYEQGQFEEAGREFERAYDLSQRGSLLFNAYLAYRDAGLVPQAARALAGYLEAEPDAENAEQLRNRLRSMQARVTEQEAAEADAEAERLRLEAEAQRLEEERAAAIAAQEAREREEARELNPLGFIVGGVGLAMVGGGVAAGVIASNERSTLEDACPGNVCPADFDLATPRDRVNTANLAADILLFGGAAIMVAGVGLLFLRGSDDDEEAPATVAGAACGPTGCMATLRGHF
ncbi:MAG: hypothetical protein AAF447_04600 [Myxococcota bacterium]